MIVHCMLRGCIKRPIIHFFYITEISKFIFINIFNLMNYILRTFTFSLFVLFSVFAYGQLSAPQAEAVYGGRINAITGIATAPDSSRIFITTESANSAFYADVYHISPDSAVFGPFQAMPDMGSTANLGSSIRDIAAHAGSGAFFFIRQPGQLVRASAAGGGLVNTSLSNLNSFAIFGDYLLGISGNRLHFGSLDASGNFTESSSSPLVLTIPPGPAPSLALHPLNGHVYLFLKGNSPKIFKSTDALSAISGTSTFTDISPSALPSSFEWSAFGIAPSGRLFLGGSDFSAKKMAYTDDESSWTDYSLPFGGAPGGNFSFSGDSAFYVAYFANAYNNNKGESGAWQGFGSPGGFETHPNDGAVYADPTGKKVVYMTTDQGIGASMNGGGRIFEINEGVEAVQVNDFSMHLSNKNVAWIASKAGIRKVSSYQGTPVWTSAIFPNGDGSPYYAAAMAGTDTNKVYVGNLRVYKSSNGGSTWKNTFSAEAPPYNFNGMGTPSSGAAAITSIAVCEWDTSIVFAGYSIEREDEGGLFFSMNGGQSWGQILLESGSIGKDVDVLDIVFTLESGDTVAYVAASYDLSSPQGRSVYRVVKSGSTWSGRQDMGPSGTSTGSTIVATINDLHRSATGDTLVACGTDAGSNHPVAYYKINSASGKWTPFSTDGFPFVAGKKGKAITIGKDTVYVAVDNELYYLASSDSVWTQGYVYPAGSQINFIYYDELLVGTGTGLYGHQGIGSTAAIYLRSGRANGVIQIHPNPVRTGNIVCTFQNPENRPFMLLIRNASGQIVYRRNAVRADRFVLSSSDLGVAGLYFVELRNGSSLYVGKVVKE
ncbi:MAG: T9SS C-terminal target domain-containing protein [Bacteroidetes bacterium]|nr:MAG: T9SS C-terminal target domain-containing protein [Bacteroidota bacterium]